MNNSTNKPKKEHGVLTVSELETMDFLQIARVDGGLESLMAAIEGGELSHAKAMEIAMYGVSYIIEKCREGGTSYLESDTRGSLSARQAAKKAEVFFIMARKHAQVTENAFSHYPLAKTVFSEMFYMIEHYKASTVTFPLVYRSRAVDAESQKTYFILNPLTGLIKIGKSADVENRIKLLKCGAGAELEVLHVIDKNIEGKLHKKFAKYRETGEWFDDRDGLIAEYIRKSGKE